MMPFILFVAVILSGHLCHADNAETVITYVGPSPIESAAGQREDRGRNFYEREAQRAEQNFQAAYNNALSHNAELAEQIRQNASIEKQQAHDSIRHVFAGAASELARLPISYLTPEQIKVVYRARNLSRSALSHRTYEMTGQTRAGLIESLNRASASKDYDRVFDLAEQVARSEVGRQLMPPPAGTILNREGVVNLSKLSNGDYSGPFDKRIWSTPIATVEGEIVRRIANEYQKVYLESLGLQILSPAQQARFVLGMMALHLGDLNLSKNNYERGSSFLELANDLINKVTDLAEGATDALIGLVRSIPELGRMVATGAEYWWNDPVGSWKSIVELANHLPELSGMIKVAALNALHGFQAADSDKKYKVAGDVAFNILFAIPSLGETAVAGAMSTAQQLTKVTAKAAESLQSLLGDYDVTEALDQASAEIVDSVDKIPEVAREGLIQTTRSSPEVAVALASARDQALAQGHVATASFIEKMMASDGQMSVEQVDVVASVHTRLMSELKNVPASEYVGPMSRGIEKGFVSDGAGGLRPLNRDDVLNLSPTNQEMEHRFSIGGPLGEKAQYFVEGELNETTKDAIKEEIRTVQSRIIFRETSANQGDLLDTTRPDALKILNRCGIKSLNDPKWSYNLTQALGNAARESGFKGIIFNSTAFKGVRNIVIFK